MEKPANSHTPGPWIAGWSGDPETDWRDSAGPITVVAEGRGGVAVCYPIATGHASTWPIVEANARLIATAPELLALARDVAAMSRATSLSELMERARTLIAKAEGQLTG